MSTSLAQDYTREFTRIVLVALGLVLLVVSLLLKSVRKVLIVLTPAFAGVLGSAVLAKAVGTDLNVMNLVSGIIVMGLCVDYGIFRVHAYSQGIDLGTRTAISLSAGTTLIGAAALLFTLHPALFSVGLTLVGGISVGYLVSMAVVPALCRLFLEEKA
jgi:predicted RND superfamily exporter protein